MTQNNHGLSFSLAALDSISLLINSDSILVQKDQGCKGLLVEIML